jgi:hypothetical protein
MRSTRVLVLVALATTLAGCATTGTPPPGGFVTKCKEIDLSNKSLEPTPLEVWEKEQNAIGQGFLRIQYSWEDPNEGPVFAVGVLYEDLQTQKLAFIVGPLSGFPQRWSPDGTKGDASTKAKDEWVRFFNKLRKVTESDRPGGVFCAGRACAMPPDSPPPELLGTASSGSPGGYAALFSGTPEQMYAQAMQAPKVMSDAVFSKTREERERIIKDLAKKTCHGVQASLGNE